MRYFNQIRNWVIADILSSNESIQSKHKAVLITNVLLLYVLIQFVSLISVLIIGGGFTFGFYISAIIFNVVLIFLLKETSKVYLVTVLFIIAAWVPTPVFFYLYGDPYLTNSLWIVALSLLSVFTIGRKWGLIAVIYGLLNFCYNFKIIIDNGGVDVSGYKLSDYVLGAIDTVFILSVTFMVVYQYLKYNDDVREEVERNNEILRKQFLVIEEQNSIKSNLLKEVHHRVKNNLQMVNSMIRLQKRVVEDENSIEVLEKVENRILTMAKLHEEIYQSDSFKIINLDDYLRELLVNLFNINGQENVSYELNVDSDIELKNDVVLYLGLLINELVINALKHAFIARNGYLKISMRRGKDKDKDVLLLVEDNGVGFDKEDLEDKKDSLGQQLIKSFVRQINGTIDIKSTPHGSTFSIKFKQD